VSVFKKFKHLKINTWTIQRVVYCVKGIFYHTGGSSRTGTFFSVPRRQLRVREWQTFN